MARQPDMQRRAEIAARALDVVLERGVHRTTMSDIARALDMKRPALYWYFSDLGAVFDAALDNLQQNIIAHVSKRMGQEIHPIDQLYAVLCAVVEFYADRRELLIGMFQLWAVAGAQGDPESLLTRERELMEPQRNFLIALLKNGIALGRVAPCDVEGLVDTMLTLVDGAQVQRVTRDADLRPMLNFVKTVMLEPLRLKESK
jgi:AcrR family transcriptional regulator